MARGAITVKIDGQYDDKDINRAIKDLNRLKSDSGAAEGPMASLGKAALAAGAAFASMATVRAVVDYLRDAALAAAEDEKSVIQLATALGNLGLAHRQVGIEDFIKQMQMATGVADTDLRSAYQRLVTATGDVEQSQKLLQTALDISAAGYGDVTSAADALAKASAGQMTSINRLVKGAIDPAIIKSKDFGAAIDALNEKFSGQAAAAAETYAGKMARIQQAADEAQETIGYALLKAIDDVSQALGGTSGLQSGVTFLGDGIAGIITVVGELASTLADLIPKTESTDDSIQGATTSFATMSFAAAALGGPLGLAASGLTNLLVAGNLVTEANEKNVRTVEALKSVWAMYKDQLGPAAAEQRAAAAAAEEAKAALDALRESQERLNTALSAAEVQISFQRFLHDIETQVAKNTKSFDGWGKGVRKNQDALIDGFKLAEQQVNSWVKQGKVDADDFESTFAGLAMDVVQGFVDDGFELKDIRKFLKANGLWSKELAAQFKGENKTDPYDESRKMGIYVGKGMDSGVASGVTKDAGIIQDAITAALEAAWIAAKNFLGIKSPSRLYAEMGRQTAQGYADGLTESTAIVVTASGALIAAGGKESQKIVRENIDAYMSLIEQAYGAMAQVAEGITSQVMGNVSLEEMVGADGSFDPAATIEALFGSLQDQASMVNTVAATIGTALPPELLNQILAMPPDAAIALANYLAANPEMLTQLTNMYAQLSLFTQDVLGEPMGAAWATVGGKSAAALIEEAKAYLLAHAKEFRRWVRENISATVDVTVNYVTGNQPTFGGARASGGPVNAGQTYLVGEKGPELLTMGASGGFVTPNDQIAAIKGGGGNTYSINVQAGVGDPRQIGQQVVEYIKRYEASNGKVFQAA